MPITGTIRKTVDLDHGVQMTPLGQLFASADHNAHTFEITLTASGKAVDVSGAGVFAYFIRNDQKTVVVTSGKAQRNVVTVTLPESCYVTDRQAAHFQLIIKVSSTPDRKAVFWGDGYITRSTTDAIIDPGHEIPSLEELLAMISDVEGVTTAARDATSKANTATTQANAARDAANTAASAANTAKANADAATKKANDAASAANTAASGADDAADAANTAASAANTAKTNADAATKKANDAASAATTAKTNADTATKAANDAAKAATTATTNANAATKSANDAAAAANTAKTNADAATAKANTAATNADTATGKANTATSNANTAATNASNAANLIKNMTVTVSKVAAGGTPTATLTTAANPDHYSLNIGVVTGDTGKTGATGSVGPKGDTGAAAGFGAITATVDNKVGTPSVEVTKGGPATATTLNFAFHNLKGNTGEIGNITVNGKGPDASGNFTVDIPFQTVKISTAADLSKINTTKGNVIFDVAPQAYSDTAIFPNTGADWVVFQLVSSVEGVQLIFSSNYVFIRQNDGYPNDFSGKFVPVGKLYTATGTAADGAMTQKAVTDALNTKANSSALSSYVPTTRKVNSKALSADISLTAADVGALPSTTTIPKLYTTTGTAADGAMTQKAVTDALNTKANSSALSGYLPLTGGTLTGDITLSGSTRGIKFNSGTRNGSPITFYSGNENGSGIVIGDGGLVIIGSGESASALRDVLATVDHLEQTYVTSDGYVYVCTNCQTIENRKTFTFGVDGSFTAPNGFKGNVSGSSTSCTGNAATATSAGKLTTARTFPPVNLAGTGSATFDGSGNPAAVGVSGTLPISHGGTGATVAATALGNLGGVPTTRKVNNKALSADISLTAADVGALPSTTTIPKLYTTTGTAADGAMTQKAVTDALNAKANSSALSSYVPTTRKVNNKALSTDISLTAADVGALPSTTTIPKPLDAYPVGAVYISLVGTSPASLFGGTWAAIEEAFLFATSQHHPEWIGQTGGHATHTLTVAELPPHTHPLMVTLDNYHAGENRNVYVSNGDLWNYDSHPISETGNGSAFSIMPPYFRVYMWQRTA